MRLGQGLAPMLGDLHRRSDRNRCEERDDQQRHRAAQKRLGFEQTLIGGMSEGAGKTAHGLRMQRCVGSVGTRHRQPPRKVPNLLSGGTAASLRITLIRIEVAVICLVPRTRSSRTLCSKGGCELRVQRDTRVPQIKKRTLAALPPVQASARPTMSRE